MAPFDETPEDDEEEFPAPDLSAIFGGGSDDDDEAAGDPGEDKLATDSLDALRDEELAPGASTSDLAIDPAKAAVIEASGEDEDDDDVEDLEELERDGFGRERDFGFDSIDEEEEDEDDDY